MMVLTPETPISSNRGILAHLLGCTVENERTPSHEPPPMTITEIKRHLDGRVERFTCDLLLWTDQAVVVRFHPQGTKYAALMRHSDGFFWTGRNYLMYQIVGADGAVVRHRFDVCKDVRISDDSVEFTDLLLDVVLPLGGDPLVEDEDEVAAATESGLLTAADLAAIDTTRMVLTTRYASIIREAEALRASALGSS